MPPQKRATLKDLIVPGLSTILLSTTLLTITVNNSAMAANHDGQSTHQRNLYQDSDFGQVSSQLRQNLRHDGYYVMDIQADGDNHIDVYAKKDHQPYILKYTYPDLELIDTEKKQWSNVWKNKRHHEGDKDVEDRIKAEARYPTVKQRAIGKMSDMGYEVGDIELAEEDNHGIFEIEAKRGAQDYEVILGYPDLDIIKLEKD